jgi:hypothetical protein
MFIIEERARHNPSPPPQSLAAIAPPGVNGRALCKRNPDWPGLWLRQFPKADRAARLANRIAELRFIVQRLRPDEGWNGPARSCAVSNATLNLTRSCKRPNAFRPSRPRAEIVKTRIG